MKRHAKTSRLSLSKTTIRNLQSLDLAKVQGGTDQWSAGCPSQKINCSGGCTIDLQCVER